MYLTKNLKGDGRRRVDPNPKFELKTHGSKMPLNLATAKKIINEFKVRGESYHSSAGAVMWVIEEYCILNEVAFESHLNDFGCGGYIKLKTDIKGGEKIGKRRKNDGGR